MAGFSTNRLIAAASTNATLVRNGPAELGGWQYFNAAAYPVFLKLYDSATIPTAGVGTPKMTLGIAAGAAAQGNSLHGYWGDSVEGCIPFINGLGFTITKLAADADTTVLVAGDCIVNLFYR